MKNRCVLIFVAGMTIATATYAFFQSFMQMPMQAMQMGSQMMMPQQQPCNCVCSNKQK